MDIRPVEPAGGRRRRRTLVADSMLAAGLAVLAVGELVVHDHWGPGQDLMSLLAALLTTVPLVFRRRFPTSVLIVVALSWVAGSIPPDAPVLLGESLGVLAALYSVVVYVRSWTTVCAAIALSFLAAYQWSSSDTSMDTGGRLISTGWILLPVAIGAVVRRHADQASLVGQRSAAAAAQMLSAERHRIARELHDATSHALAVVILHARGGRLALDHGDLVATAQALDVLTASSQAAAVDLRALLAVLMHSSGDQAAADEPLLHLGQLPGLLDVVRTAGHPVELVIVGDIDDLSAGLQHSVFRIVQEALTNVLKHAGSAAVSVRICRGAEGLSVRVTDDGPGGGPAFSGHGLIGMRERVLVHGGTLETGVQAGGGFRIAALLPVSSSS